MRTDWTHPRAAATVVAASPDADILAEITSGLAAGSDLHALLQRFLDPVMRIAGAQAGVVRVLDPEGGRLRTVSQLGLPAAVAQSESLVDPACGVCGSAFARDVIASDVHLVPCLRRSDAAYFGAECRQVVAVPLTHRGSVLGLYTLFHARPVELRDDTSALLKTIGELLGLALNNARLEHEALRSAVLLERQTMAAEVHDSVAQTLAFVKMRMPLLQQAVRDHDRDGALKYCNDVRQAVSSAHTNLRHIVQQFRAPMDPLGLKHALHAGIAAFSDQTGIKVSLDDRAPGLRLPPAHETQVFRIVQEALSNIGKHAGARHAWVTIAHAPGGIDVLIEDDGSGLAAAPAAAAGENPDAHFGLEIMRQRAARLAGRLDVAPRAGGGTRLQLHFPAPAGDGARA